MNEFDRTAKIHIPEGMVTDGIRIIQVNLGRYCNLSCRHCHLECSSSRVETMSWEVMEEVLRIIRKSSYDLVDITGGAPELHPDFKRFIELLSDKGSVLQVRTNLVALIEDRSRQLPELLRDKQVNLVASLPCYLEENVDYQRGKTTYRKSIRAIQKLNELGYGTGSDLKLNLVYNPNGAFLPGDQTELERVYQSELRERFDIVFDRLLTITNMPIGRFNRQLRVNGEEVGYWDLLKNAFNPYALDNVMCRQQVCIDWDGRMYDCDFNIALNLPICVEGLNHVNVFDEEALKYRRIATGSHCFGCTAGTGSSCAGAIV